MGQGASSWQCYDDADVQKESATQLLMQQNQWRWHYFSSFLQVDMSDKMVNIDGNLDQVKRNLEYLEEMYDTVFRKVNRLFVDVEI